MQLKSHLSRLLALVLVVVIGLVGCSNTPAGLSGDYNKDTIKVIETLLIALEPPAEASELSKVQSQARQQINDYISFYRRDSKSGSLRSFTTMQTALNSLAGYYTAYGTRPVPDKLKNRLKLEFQQAQQAVERGN